MAESLRVAILHDELGGRTVSVSEEQLSILKALMWSGRPFQIVYHTGDHEMFRSLIRLQVKAKGGKPGDWVVQHILQQSQAAVTEA